MDVNKTIVQARLAEFYKKSIIKQLYCLLNFLSSKFISKLHHLYLKCIGFDNKEIRFIQMIWKAKIKGLIHQSLRKYQR